jgi:hypothetical protein
MRFALKTTDADDNDAFVAALLDLGVDAMWLPIRMYLAMSALGLSIITISAIALWISYRSGGGVYGGPGGTPAPTPPGHARRP